MAEKETVINWMEDDEFASVFTYDGRLKNKFSKYPGKDNGKGGVEFTVPVSDLLIQVRDRSSSKKAQMSDDERQAIGIRLQTAKASKFGLTLPEYKSLRLRPGQAPTEKQIADAKAGIVPERETVESGSPSTSKRRPSRSSRNRS